MAVLLHPLVAGCVAVAADGCSTGVGYQLKPEVTM
jgi:hypothetical protein